MKKWETYTAPVRGDIPTIRTLLVLINKNMSNFFSRENVEVGMKDPKGRAEKTDRDELSLAEAFSALVFDERIGEKDILGIIDDAGLSGDEVNLVAEAFARGEDLRNSEFDLIRERIITTLTLRKAEVGI